METPTVNALTIDEFCFRNKVCRATLYNLWGRGEGPRRYKVGSRTYISIEAERDWQRQLETLTGEAA